MRDLGSSYLCVLSLFLSILLLEGLDLMSLCITAAQRADSMHRAIAESLKSLRDVGDAPSLLLAERMSDENGVE